MTAIQIRTTGSTDVMEVVDLEKPIPGPGEVLVRIESISVNFADTMVRRGIYAPMPMLPTILGMEGSGVVAAIGENVSKMFEELPVAFMGPNCYAQYVVVNERSLIPLPEWVDLDEAAAFPITYLTAYHILHTLARVQIGETVLCYAAAGGVGIALAQLAKLAQLTLIGLTSSDEKAQFASQQGYDHVINYKTENVVARVREITGGKGVNLILNSVAGKSFGIDFKMLAPLGQVIWFGLADGGIDIDITKRLAVNYNRSIGIRTFYLHSVPRDVMLKSIGILLDLLSKKRIKPCIYERIPLSEAGRAHQLIESGATMGKIILKP